MSTINKGTRYAKEVADHLGGLGMAVERRPWLEAGDDMTALAVGPRRGLALSVECKNVRAYRFGDWIDQAVMQKRQFGSVPIVVAKRNGQAAVDRSFVVLRLADLGRLIGLEA